MGLSISEIEMARSIPETDKNETLNRLLADSVLSNRNSGNHITSPSRDSVKSNRV